MFIRRPWRRVNDQVVQALPQHVSQELLYEPVLARTTPNNRCVSLREHEANRHHCEVVFEENRRPSCAASMHIATFQAKHAGDARTTDVDVEYADVNSRVLR